MTDLTSDTLKTLQDIVLRSAPVTNAVELIEAGNDEAAQNSSIGEVPLIVTRRADGSADIKSAKSYLDEWRFKPQARKGQAVATTLKSFIALINRHKDNGTVVFASTNWKAPRLTAVLDYHLPVDSSPTINRNLREDPLARPCEHHITYGFPLSEQWQVWVDLHTLCTKEALSSAEFSRFLQRHIAELASPTEAEQNQWGTSIGLKFAAPNTLLGIARSLQINVNSEVENTEFLESGETRLTFNVEHKDAKTGLPINIPNAFLLNIAPFDGGDMVRIPVLLNYRVNSGKITWTIQLFRPDLYITERVRADIDQVAKDTACPVFEGAPESGV